MERQRSAGLAAEPNKPKILKAPMTVIIGHDLDFADKLPKLLPHAAEVMQKYFAAPDVAEVTAMRNGTLPGAYLIVAARALGLDCGPMSGFDNAGVVLLRHAGSVELHLQHWSRRSSFRVSAQSSP
jgi:3-hydroxypropanoate dehydrogenase